MSNQNVTNVNVRNLNDMAILQWKYIHDWSLLNTCFGLNINSAYNSILRWWTHSIFTNGYDHRFTPLSSNNTRPSTLSLSHFTVFLNVSKYSLSHLFHNCCVTYCTCFHLFLLLASFFFLTHRCWIEPLYHMH